MAYHQGIVHGRGPKPTKAPPKSVAVPQPGEWERHQSAWAEQNHADPCWPEVADTENPVVATLLGPTGAPLRQWRARPPFGFQARSDRTEP